MGQSESTANGSEEHRQAGAIVNGVRLTRGYHCAQVQPNSPAAHAGLQSFFDFVLAANGVVFEREDDAFKAILAKSSAPSGVELLVYNLRSERTRTVRLVPQVGASGQQVVGISIRFTDFQSVDEHVWHVLDVYPRSPAVDAGLVARSDYIVGTPDLQFVDAEDFFTYVEANMGQPIRLYVFSLATDSVRLVSITPNNQWGGHGCLGCDVGFGFLHRIPKQPDSPAALAATTAEDHSQCSHAGHSHAHGSHAGHSHAHGSHDDAAAAERKLHPLMIPTANGFQQPLPQLAVPPATAAKRAVVDATGAAVAPTQHLSFITLSDDVLNKPPPGPPPTTPYIAAAPKAAPAPQAPPTRFMPAGVELAAAPAVAAAPHSHTHAHGATCNHDHSHDHAPPKPAPAPAAVAERDLSAEAPVPAAVPMPVAPYAQFQMPPGDEFASIQL
jgi:hypothetical protein